MTCEWILRRSVCLSVCLFVTVGVSVQKTVESPSSCRFELLWFYDSALNTICSNNARVGFGV
jgi:hypothetical protein